MQQNVAIGDREGVRVCVGQQHESRCARLLGRQMVNGAWMDRPDGPRGGHLSDFRVSGIEELKEGAVIRTDTYCERWMIERAYI